MFKRIGVYVIIGLLSVVSIFAIFNTQNITSVSASEIGETYSYTADIVTDYDTSFLNGIDSVESVSFNYNTYLLYTFNSSFSISINIYSTQALNLISTSTSTTFEYMGFRLNRYDEINYSADCFTFDLALYGQFRLSSYDKSSTLKSYFFVGTCNKILITDLFADNFSYQGYDYFANYDNYVTSRSYQTFSDDLSYYLDMNSETNFNYSFSDFLNAYNYNWGSYTYSIIDYIYNVLSCKEGTYIFDSGRLQDFDNNDLKSLNVYFRSSATASTSTSVQNEIRTNLFYYTLTTTYYSDFNSDLNKYPEGVTIENKLIINDFTVVVNKPVNRTENTLVLYNYDYDCAISSINSVEYALSKDLDIYKAKYTGTLPNSRTIGFSCAELQNRLYDEYIYIYLTFTNNVIDFDELSFSLGFDFNFSRFYEPLVIQDSIFFQNISFPGLTKPEHWYQFAGWIMYGITYVLFYNPIISPVTKFLFPVISILINVCKFILHLPLGQFVLAYVGFMVIIKFIGSFMPNGGIGGVVVNSTTNLVQAPVNIKKNKLDKFAKKQRYNELNKKYISEKTANKNLKKLQRDRKRKQK